MTRSKKRLREERLSTSTLIVNSKRVIGSKAYR